MAEIEASEKLASVPLMQDEDVEGCRERAQRVIDEQFPRTALSHNYRTLELAASVVRLVEEIKRQRAVVAELHGRVADDRCWMDEDRLFAAFGLPPARKEVGDTEEMLKNCISYINRMCTPGGKWPTYRELLSHLREIKDYAYCCCTVKDCVRCRVEDLLEGVS